VSNGGDAASLGNKGGGLKVSEELIGCEERGRRWGVGGLWSANKMRLAWVSFVVVGMVKGDCWGWCVVGSV